MNKEMPIKNKKIIIRIKNKMIKSRRYISFIQETENKKTIVLLFDL